MKITEKKLRQIIRHELKEAFSAPTPVNHETLVKTYDAIVEAGAPVISKTRSAAYSASEARDPEIKQFYQQGAFAVTHRTLWGSLDDLEAAVKKAGYTVRAAQTIADSRVVVFDVP